MTWKLSEECKGGGRRTRWFRCEQSSQGSRDEGRSSDLAVIRFCFITLTIISLCRGVNFPTGKDSEVTLHLAQHF